MNPRAKDSGEKRITVKNLITGKYGEWLAVRYLKKKGYEIVGRNEKTPAGEIDIVARDADVLVFAEVKTRTGDRFGHPSEAVDARKRKKMEDSALLYLKRFKQKIPQARFDVICVTIAGSKNSIEHIADAFELSGGRQ
jgi:putative endonuclease